MVSWLLVIILAYLFFALASLGDKIVLSGPPNPISYTFYVGFLSILIVFIIPFTGLQVPSANILFWIILEAIVFVFGLYFMYSALEKFEVSKVMTTVGATQPILIFFTSWLFWGYQAMTATTFFAFLLLFAGSFFISFEKKPELTGKYLKITMLTSLMYSLDYVLSKYIFINFSFIQGFIWMRIFIFLFVLFLLFKKENRKEIFKKKNIPDNNAKEIFFATQMSGGVATILQSFAIFLAPIAFLPVVNSLRGMQYIFLFIIALFFTFFFPKILKEKVSKQIILRKAISIFLIVFGLAVLIF